MAVIHFRKLFLILFLLPNGAAFAQPNDRPAYEGFQDGQAMYHWTTSNGLPQSHISGITQSADKLMWFATYNGVVNFDGRKFNRIVPEDNDQAISPFVTAIRAFGDTIAWASPQEIVYYYDHRMLAVIPITDPNIFITAIAAFNGKRYFQAHDRVYFAENGKLVPLIRIASEKRLKDYTILTGVFSQNRYTCLMRHASGNTLLYVYDYLTKKRKVIHTKVPYDNLTLRSDKLIAQTGNQWVALNSKLQPGKVIQKSPVKEEGRLQSGMESDCFFYYTKSQLAISHDGCQPAVLYTGKTMYGVELFASFQDHSGNLWLGTNSLGLFMFRKYPFTLFNFFKDEPVNNSSHAFVDDEGLLWFDNECKLTIGFDLRNLASGQTGGEIRHQIPDVCNWTDASWSKDSLALFAYGTEHHWYDKRTQRLTSMAGISTPITNFLKVSPQHYILAGEGALYHWYGKQLIPWKQFRSPKTTCNQLICISKDEYFFATSEGLYHFNSGKWELITGDMENPDFRSLHRVKNSPYLLIGTDQSGILRYNTKSGSIQKLSIIPVQILSCWSIIEDRFGQLWVTSNNGIVQLFLQDLMDCFDGRRHFLTLNHYRHENGIDNVEFNSRTGNKGTLLADGSIVFSSLGGPVIVHPQSNRLVNASLGNLLIERITVNQQVQTSVEKLTLKEGDFVQLLFTIPSFSSERVLNFEYRVKGNRTDWAPTANRQITLDNLPAGNYLLEIRTTSGERTLTIPIAVKKLHPNSWIFTLLLILAGALCIIFTTRYFTKRAQQKKHALNDLKQQLKLLEMEALRAQMNPHFIFNCLNTIQFLFISGNVARANKYLTNFSGLMRMTLDLLRQPITTLDLELKTTNLYVELEQLQFDDGFDFRLINRLDTPVSRIRVPSLFFQVFVENAILHGLRKTDQPRPILSLILEETPTAFVFRVCDNGPGISQPKKEDHTSIGIKLLAERFALKSEIYNWPMEFTMHEHESIGDDIKTEIIITFGKVLLETTENEYPDRR